WNATVALAGRVSLRQGGYPVVSASPLAPGVVTIAWNTPTKQVYTTFDGTAVATTPTTIWVNGIANGIPYAGGYSTVVEPAPREPEGVRRDPEPHRRVPSMPEARRLARAGRSGEGCPLRGPAVLGTTGARVRRPSGARPRPRARAGRTRRQPDGADLHGRS